MLCGKGTPLHVDCGEPAAHREPDNTPVYPAHNDVSEMHDVSNGHPHSMRDNGRRGRWRHIVAFIALLLSVGLVSPTAFPFRIAKSRQSSRSMPAALGSRCLNTILYPQGVRLFQTQWTKKG